jgi:MFS family permease
VVAANQALTLRTDIPARLDRLPWSAWHWRILVGLGTVWILDGLEVTIVGAIGNRLTRPESGLGLTAAQLGEAAAIYVAGAALGALVFGHLTDRLGRKRMFLLTLAIYIVATLATALSFGAWTFFLCRLFTGAAIGGEYSAINSAIDELIPARVRGLVDLSVNGSFWLGAFAGAALSIPLLEPTWFASNLGWRLAFALGAVLSVAIILVRRYVPESPRWLLLHGRSAEAEGIVSRIEQLVTAEKGQLPTPIGSLQLRPNHRVGFGAVVNTLIKRYPKRTLLCLALFVGQAFLYNSIFFTQALVLGKYFGIGDARIGYFVFPIALGNLLGPLALGTFFDRFGRRLMISASFITSGLLLIVTADMFQIGALTAASLTLCWVVVFFFASAAASSAYLTVSEIFPLEIRALAIALFYAVGTSIGGIIGPILLGAAIESGTISAIARGYYWGAVLMIIAGVAEIALGVEAARRTLEQVAPPLSQVNEDVRQ